jgi:Protein of unknown function (DUF998)
MLDTVSRQEDFAGHVDPAVACSWRGHRPPIGGGHNLQEEVVSVSSFSAPATRSAYEQAACDRSTAITRSLLGYLALAGPFYVLGSLAQGLTRTGFSLRRDEWSLLALGHLGWIQMANLALTGAMLIAGAIGMRRAMGRVAADGRWAPRLLACYGAGLVLAGMFRADPANGFPAGTPAGPARHVSTHGMLHLLSGSLGFVCLVGACFVVARGMSMRGAARAAIVARLVGGLFTLAFAAIATGDESAAVNLAFTAAVIIASGWLSYLAVRIYRSVPATRPVR